MKTRVAPPVTSMAGGSLFIEIKEDCSDPHQVSDFIQKLPWHLAYTDPSPMQGTIVFLEPMSPRTKGLGR